MLFNKNFLIFKWGMAIKETSVTRHSVLFILLLLLSVPLINFAALSVSSYNMILICLAAIFVIGSSYAIPLSPSLRSGFFDPLKMVGGRFGHSNEWVSPSPFRDSSVAMDYGGRSVSNLKYSGDGFEF